MADQRTKVERDYRFVFNIDASKLSRITSLIEDSFRDIEIEPIMTYRVKFSNGKFISLTDLERVISLDNTEKNPIISLRIKCTDFENNTKNSCEVFLNKKGSSINLEVLGEKSKWTNELFAEIDEQIERTKSSEFVYRFVKENQDRSKLIVLPIMLLAFFPLMIASIFSSPSNLYRDYYLTESNLNHISETLDGATTSDEKTDALFEIVKIQISNIKDGDANDPIKLFFTEFSLPKLFVVLPIIIIVLVLIYTLYSCYPGSIFLWGDHIGFHESIINKRRLLWTTFIIALVVGIISNLFVFGFTELRG